MASFLNEHSIELLMIPKLINQLSNQFKKITPVYFWGNREGSTLGKKNLKDIPLRVIAMYARRPKIVRHDSSRITIKINQELILKSRILSKHYIPSLAGIPLINTLSDFNTAAEFLWFNVNAFEGETIIPIPLKNKAENRVFGTLNNEELMKFINENTGVIYWEEATAVFAEINRTFNLGKYLAYKPIYLLLSQ
jgi:hypothetical protein